MPWTDLIDRLFRAYYFCKFYPFRKERLARRAAGEESGFVGIQLDGLSAPHLQQALAAGYLPNIARHLRRGYVLREYRAGLPSTTPAAQGAIFWGDGRGIPAFRWFEKATGRLISCNDPDQVQHFRERLFAGREGLLAGGSSYANMLDGGADRSIFTVSSPHPQTLFGRFGGGRLLLLILLHPLRVCRMLGASILEYLTELYDRWHFRKTRPWQVSEGLFPFIRIFCNVILRELQTFGVIADIYAGIPCIYTTYSGYDELAHHFGPASRPALKNLKYTDKRIGEIMRMLRHAPGARYELILLSDHGQTPGYPFHDRFGATLGETVSAFLRQSRPAVAATSVGFGLTRVQLDYLRRELDAHTPAWHRRFFRRSRNYLQRKISELVPETLKFDHEGGVVITYSSSLAHLYLTGSGRPLSWRQVEAEQPELVRFLSEHPGIGFVLARGEERSACCFFHRGGRLCLDGWGGSAGEEEFLRPYGEPRHILPDLRRLAADSASGDLILFGAYDGERIACFDDQVGGHGSVGGEQQRPFLILPAGHPLLAREELSGYVFLYRELFLPLRRGVPRESDLSRARSLHT